MTTRKDQDAGTAAASQLTNIRPFFVSLVDYGANHGGRDHHFVLKTDAVGKAVPAADASAEGFAPARVLALLAHPDFTLRNPNRARALVFQFCLNNPRAFHAADGGGYDFVADWLMRLDPVNPQTTARMMSLFETWPRYDAPRRARAGPSSL